jgi:hypothetical protein
MQYQFSDLVDLPSFQQMLQSLRSVAGIATTVLDEERAARSIEGNRHSTRSLPAKFCKSSPIPQTVL